MQFTHDQYSAADLMDELTGICLREVSNPLRPIAKHADNMVGVDEDLEDVECVR